MMIVRKALPLLLVALLAACGTNSPVDPTDPTVTTDPTTTTDPTDPTVTTDPTDPTITTDPTDPTSTTDPTDPTPDDVSGTWTGTTTTTLLGAQSTTFTFTEVDDGVTGTLVLSGDAGSAETAIFGSLSGSTLTLAGAITVTDDLGNESDVSLVYEGEITETTYEGTVLLLADSVEQDSGTFSVTKTAE